MAFVNGLSLALLAYYIELVSNSYKLLFAIIWVKVLSKAIGWNSRGIA